MRLAVLLAFALPAGLQAAPPRTVAVSEINPTTAAQQAGTNTALVPFTNLDTYDKHHPEVTTKLHGLAQANWDRDVPFMWQGQEVMKDTGYGNAWGFLLDQIHHRGQLSTYLRPMGSTVPAIYGPSADEGM